ncbi:hypothetical protein Scep_003818 [Stephania cephalantha]|uniref:hAT-like transposase RNase-H fold domain-containing protein n=1 Tax=Stephania cephalantha TaxID=152367 RepID=A0AAP0KU02_9MAGN
MLDSAVKYQRAFERLYESYDKVSSELKKGVPTKEDWSVARILLQFLELFYWATLRLSGSKCVTANAYFHEVHAVETLINECLASNDSYVHSMGMKMKVKFDKYWGDISKVNMILLVAVVLDPRYKLKFLKYCYGTLYPNEQVVEMIRKVREALDHLYMEYESFSNNYMSTWFNETRSLSSVREEAEDSLFGNVRAKRAVVGFQRFLEEDANTTNKSEIYIYIWMRDVRSKMETLTFLVGGKIMSLSTKHFQ